MEKVTWFLTILSGDSLGKGRETKIEICYRFGGDGGGHKSKTQPKPSYNENSRVQNWTGNGERKIVGMTPAEHGRCFVDFHTKNPWRFVTLSSPTTLWEAPEGLTCLWRSLAHIQFGADKGVASRGTVVSPAFPNSTKCPPVFTLKRRFRDEGQK